MSFTVQIETISYIQKVPQCLIFSPVSLFTGMCKIGGAGGLRRSRAGGWEPSSHVGGLVQLPAPPCLF